MTICMSPNKTLKASSLNNRGSARPSDRTHHTDLHSEGVPQQMWEGDPFRVDMPLSPYPGVLAPLVPPVIERRPRCGLI